MTFEFDDRRSPDNPDEVAPSRVPPAGVDDSPRGTESTSAGDISGQPTQKKSSTSWQRRIVRMLVLFVVVPYVLVLLLVVVMQRRLLYPAGRGSDLSAAATGLPDDMVSDVTITAADGNVLHGLHYRSHPRPHDDAGTAAGMLPGNAASGEFNDTAENDTAETPPDSERRVPVAGHSVKLLIFFPGNAGHRLSRTYSCQEFTRLGLDVLLVDYRGYGDNDGAPTEADIARDVREVWKFATAELGHSPREIIVFGESLGGAVATRLVSELCREGIEPAGLVLQSTFASLSDVAQWHFSIFPVRWLLFDRYPSVDRIRHVTCPVLMFHGRRDSIVPYSQGEKLFAAVPDDSSGGLTRRFVPLPHSGHNDISATVLAAELTAFLRQVASESTHSPPAKSPAEP